MSCFNCGSELPGGARFCPSCGAPVSEPNAIGQGVDGRNANSWEVCEIACWRGYLKADFYARRIGSQAEIARSPVFRWRRNDPPPPEGPFLEAHQALVSLLTNSGWQSIGEAQPWYAQQFRRPRAGYYDFADSVAVEEWDRAEELAPSADYAAVEETEQPEELPPSVDYATVEETEQADELEDFADSVEVEEPEEAEELEEHAEELAPSAGYAAVEETEQADELEDFADSVEVEEPEEAEELEEHAEELAPSLRESTTNGVRRLGELARERPWAIAGAMVVVSLSVLLILLWLQLGAWQLILAPVGGMILGLAVGIALAALWQKLAPREVEPSPDPAEAAVSAEDKE